MVRRNGGQRLRRGALGRSSGGHDRAAVEPFLPEDATGRGRGQAPLEEEVPFSHNRQHSVGRYCPDPLPIGGQP